ncbi:MFS transporter [Paenibacillus sediminis]|uniref:MFS family permease n=1 Tax=Paenibacillus sediminis TaxID=664909 RepID=A0ABS4H6L3_9BACL|nr:MFS family permease [Paenibacillus sediminis]
MEEPQDNRLWTKEFIMLTICNLLLFLNLQMIISPLPAYVKETFHADNLTVSLFTTLFALSAIAARLYSAKALEKGKRNLILFLGLFLSSLFLAVFIAVYVIAMMKKSASNRSENISDQKVYN